MILDKSLLDNIDQMSLEDLEELYAYFSDYEETPVSIQQFIEDDEFLGQYFNGMFNPYWMGVLKEIYPSPFYSPYWLISLRGSIGRGKTTASCTGIAYDLYKLLCMVSPQDRLGMIRSTKVVFAIFNITLGLATNVVWDQLTQMFEASPFFNKRINTGRNADTLFPKRLDFFTGSRVAHSLGRAIYSAIISEANFEILNDQVEKNFTSILRRMQSRFQAKGKGIPGKVWVDSSEGDKLAAINKLINSYKGYPGVLVNRGPLWQVWPERYGDETFRVYKGNEISPPKILDMANSDDVKIIKEDPTSLIYVPEEMRKDFDSDLYAALRDLAGEPSTGNSKFMKLHDKIFQYADIELLFPETMIIDFYDETDAILDRCLKRAYFDNIANPHAMRCIHVDIAISGDRLGISSSYIRRFVPVVTKDMHTFETVYEEVPEIVTEWAFGIDVKVGQEIPLYKVRNFIVQLAKGGYPILMVSTDGFQSVDFRQQLTLAGFNTELISVDRSILQYVTWRQMVYRGFNHYPKNSILIREMKDLEMTDKGRKVDHPDKSDFAVGKGTKDIADAVCGSVYAAHTTVEVAKTVAYYNHEEDKNMNQSPVLAHLRAKMKLNAKINPPQYSA